MLITNGKIVTWGDKPEIVEGKALLIKDGLITRIENGSSLKAAGYTCEGRAGGLEWNGAKAPKQADQYPRQMKTRWVKKKEGLHGS